ncbi:MAG: BamA/TamA family outer membrane protein [Candidatus Latescibacterota bacterium]
MRLFPHIRLYVLALLIVAFSMSFADASYFGRNKVQFKDFQWEILNTPHFEIYFYRGEEAFAARAALILEDGYQMISGKLQSTLPWKVPIILYGSHNDFQQTNVSSGLIPEGVQGFAEPSRKRVVLPFNESYHAFRHTAVHELAHVFTFNIVYNQLLDNVFSRSYLFPMPLWIVEGVAEYLSVGWDADSDMFIRDAVIYDYIMDLDYVGGFYVYKEGQSVFNYIADNYGKEKILEILDVLSTTRSGDAALEATVGLNTRELSERWTKSLRKHYWPLYGNKMDVDQIGRRLTNHIKSHNYYNTKPVLSPDGETIAFFSDKGGLVSIYIMSALDGEIIKKLITGQRSRRFESLHFYYSSLSFSPDGSRIAFIAKSKERDALFIQEIASGDIVKKITIHSDGLSAPDWSPMGDSIILSATINGQTDLLLVDLEKDTYRRLTNDPADQLSPRFFPDGKRIVFTYYPEITIDVPPDFAGERKKILSEMDFLSPHNVRHDASMDIYQMDLSSAAIRPLVQTAGDDKSPMVLKDGKTLIYTSDESGITNLYVGNIETGEHHRFTDIIGGLFDPDVDEDKGRITFSAFIHGGYDIYISDDLEELLKRRYTSDDILGDFAAAQDRQPPGGDSTAVEIATGPSLSAEILQAAAADSVVSTDDLLTLASADADSILSTFTPGPLKDPPILIRPSRMDSVPRAGLPPGGVPIEGIHEPVRSEEVTMRGATVSNYKTRLSPDYVGQGAGLYYSTGFGFGLQNTIALSDMLGNHRLVFSVSLYRDLENSDFLGSYFYLKRRVNYGFGAFQFKNYLNSRMSSIGESFTYYQLFSERNYGVFGLVSFPFSTFYRMDLELQAFISEREFYKRADWNPYTNSITLVPGSVSRRRLIEPSLSFTHDTAFFSSFGPVEGSRWTISLSQGVSFSGHDVERSTAFLDYRWYKTLFYRNSFAFRVAGAVSEGKDARAFFLGGPTTLRGYDYLVFTGTRMGLVNLEYRYPLVDALIFGWPGRWGFTNIGGTLFFDAGAAWDKDDFEAFWDSGDKPRFKDIRSNFGFGTYFHLGYFLLNFQFAWPTDLQRVGDSQFHFFFGPAF